MRNIAKNILITTIFCTNFCLGSQVHENFLQEDYFKPSPATFLPQQKVAKIHAPSFCAENNLFQEIKASTFTNLLGNSLEKGAIYKKILSSYPDLIFGQVQAYPPIFLSEMSQERQTRIHLGNKVFAQYFNANDENFYEFNDLITFLDRLNIPNNHLLSLAKSFRHIYDPYHTSHCNQLGDFIAEYLLIRLIKKCESTLSSHPENKTLLATAFYELSQIDSHLMDFNKINYLQDHQGFLEIPSYHRTGDTRNFLLAVQNDSCILSLLPLSFQNIVERKITLLKTSLKYNSNYNPTWTRIIEFCFHDLPSIKKENFLPSNSFVFKNFENLSEELMQELDKRWNNCKSDSNCFLAKTKTSNIDEIFAGHKLNNLQQSKNQMQNEIQKLKQELETKIKQLKDNIQQKQAEKSLKRKAVNEIQNQLPEEKRRRTIELSSR